MKLIGMLDSPFVRRTAISLNQMGLSFEHQSLSVFSDFATFKAINPLVKAPTLVLDDGTTLMDSSLILQYAETIAPRSLYESNPVDFAHQQQIIGLASIANEKTVQIVYEYQIRPEDKRHQPWVERIEDQLSQAFSELEKQLVRYPELFNGNRLSHASIAAAIAYNFTANMRPEQLRPDQHPTLKAWSGRCESLPAFCDYPYDDAMSSGAPWSTK